MSGVADEGYQGAAKRPEAAGVAWQVAMRPGKGLAKNTAQLMALFALSNLWMARRWLMQRVTACVRLECGVPPKSSQARKGCHCGPQCLEVR